MDNIKIKNLEIYAKHGVLEEENKLGQKFLVSAKLFMDVSEISKLDNIDFSVNYSEVCKMITKYVEEENFKLIETVAKKLVYKIMDDYPILNGVSIKVKKPWAPIGLPLKTVSVKMKRFRQTVYISLGSNMGDKKKYIFEAIDQLNKIPGCIVEKMSDMIETKPYRYLKQDNFINGVLEMKTILLPNELLDCLHDIEAKANRERKIRYGPRTLDLDIIFYGDKVINNEYVNIPHIDMENREFVLKPLMQIAPFMRHPVLKRTVSQLLDDLYKRENK